MELLTFTGRGRGHNVEQVVGDVDLHLVPTQLIQQPLVGTQVHPFVVADRVHVTVGLDERVHLALDQRLRPVKHQRVCEAELRLGVVVTSDTRDIELQQGNMQCHYCLTELPKRLRTIKQQ